MSCKFELLHFPHVRTVFSYLFKNPYAVNSLNELLFSSLTEATVTDSLVYIPVAW